MTIIVSQKKQLLMGSYDLLNVAHLATITQESTNPRNFLHVRICTFVVVSINFSDVIYTCMAYFNFSG